MIFYDIYYDKSQKKWIIIEKKDNFSTILNDLLYNSPDFIWANKN